MATATRTTKRRPAPRPATDETVADVPPRGNPAAQAPDLIALGWTFTECGRVQAAEESYQSGSGHKERYLNAWRIENPLLAIDWTVYHGALDGAILEARRQQAGKVGYPRPVGTPEHTTVPTAEIVAGRWQPRTTFDEAALEELAESITVSGLLNPPLVFWNERGQWELVAGERRWRAAALAGLDEIPVQVMEGSAKELQAAAVIDNVQREDLTPMEEGAAYERLIQELSLSENELSRRLGKPRTYIQTRRAIAAGAPELHQALAAGTLTVTHARAIAAGAPGDHASQARATEEVRELFAGGGRVPEQEAQRRAERAVLEANIKNLRKLGWKVDKPDPYRRERPYVWSDADRPRQWTGAEILAAVRDGMRPAAGSITPATIDAAAKSVFSRRGVTLLEAKHSPWIGVGDAFVDADELPGLLESVRGEIDALEARFTAAGWTLSWERGDSWRPGDTWRATSAAGRLQEGWSWTTAVRLVEGIEAGEVAAEPSPAERADQAARVYTQACTGCKQEFDHRQLRFESGRARCSACQAAHQARADAALAATRGTLIAELGAWLDAAPDRALRLLLIGAYRLDDLPEVYRLSERVKAIKVKDRGELQEILTRHLVGVALDHKHLGGEPLREKESSA